MPQHPKNTIAQQLDLAQLAISNTLSDAEILKIVTEYGYGSPKMNEGKNAYAAALKAANA